MTIKALRRPVHARRLNSQLNESRRSRRVVPTPTGRPDRGRPIARWRVSADGSLALTWMRPRRAGLTPNASEEAMADPNPRSPRPGARARRTVMACS